MKAIVNTYMFDDAAFSDTALRVKIFPSYDAEWLRFVAANREGRSVIEYDLNP